MEGPKAIESKQEQEQHDFISASSPYSSSQLSLQPENSNVADLRQASISRWTREVDVSPDIAHHYAPLDRPDSSIEEAVLEDRSERKGNASQGASPITKPNFDEQAAISERPFTKHEHPVITTTTAPAASTSTTKIASVVVQCVKDLSRLVSEDLSLFASEVPPPLWKDELGRLRVWAANIGAHQTGQSSLDHRLRDASHIKEQTLRVLQRLQRTTQDINDVLHHSPEDDDFSDLSGDEDSDEHQTEIQSIYHALRDTINNLFQMSMVIRQPAQHDRLVGTKRSDAVFYEKFDQLHVTAKYPQAGEDILKRLGLAISQRRAVMRYRERHRTKLGQGLNQVIEDQTDGQSAKLSDTVATEFVEVPPVAKDNLELLTVASQTSYAQTILNGVEGTVLPPPPKDSADGAPFECPYCFVIITITNRTAWARHVFNDLMPYLCIFPSCPTPHRLYESRREWFAHLQSQHSISESPDVHVDCPLCLSSLPSGKQLERHLGRHLEELALFALPRSEEDDDEAAISPDEDSDKSHDPVGEGRCPQCDLVFRDLRAHVLTHNRTERPEKCPIVTCEYHTKGFARKYDRHRHVLAHYRGVMVCHFCPDPGTPKEKSFNRADVFKRHLSAVHMVNQLPPNQRNTRPIPSIEIGMKHTSDSTGNCSICNETFRDAQDFIDHIDNCITIKVLQGSSEPINHEVNDDEEMKKASKHNFLGAEDPIDPPDYKNSHNDHGSSSKAEPQSARENNLPGEINLEVHEPVVSYKPEYLADPTSTQPIHWDRRWDDDESEPDVIALRYRGTIYPLRFPAYAIEDGVLTVGALRLEAAKKVGAPFPNLVSLVYKGITLRDDNQMCKEKGLKQHSEVQCVIPETDPNTPRDISDYYERGHASSLPQAQSKTTVNKDKKTRRSSSLRGETETASSPFPPSQHTLSAPPRNLPRPPPNIELLHTAMEQVTALARWFEHEMIPLCDEYIAHPPADIKKRVFEHEKLSETMTILAQVMFKADGIDPNGDETARIASRALIKNAQQVLGQLEAARDSYIGHA